MSAPMVRAILDGSKTQTRRVIKDTGLYAIDNSYHPVDVVERERKNLVIAKCPYGQSGDRLWVRETFRFPKSLAAMSPSKVAESALNAGYRNPWAPIKFEADDVTIDAGALRDFGGEWGKTRVSIHMPRWVSRITLEIVSVGVERLNEISEADAIAEGATGDCPVGYIPAYEKGPHSYHYAQIWESINGPGSWALNPWVWVVEFRRVS